MYHIIASTIITNIWDTTMFDRPIPDLKSRKKTYLDMSTPIQVDSSDSVYIDASDGV